MLSWHHCDLHWALWLFDDAGPENVASLQSVPDLHRVLRQSEASYRHEKLYYAPGNRSEEQQSE